MFLKPEFITFTGIDDRQAVTERGRYGDDMEYCVDGHEVVLDVKAITPDDMDRLAVSLLAAYKASGAYQDVPNGGGSVTRKVIRSYDPVLYDLSRRAEKVARHMRLNSVESAVEVFGFTTILFSYPAKGEFFRIPKGTPIFSTHPKFPQGGKPAVKSLVIKIHGTSRGYYNDYHAQDGIGWYSGQIRWVGTGGYWHWIRVSDLISQFYTT